MPKPSNRQPNPKAPSSGNVAMPSGELVDPEPEDWWIDLRDESYIGALKVPVGGGEGVPIGNLVPATIRQIGFEVLTTLDALDDAAGD